MCSTQSAFVRLGTMTLMAACLASPRTNGGDLPSAEFDKVKSLKEAIEVVKQNLKRDGKPEYAALLSEDRIRKAIRTGVKSYEAILEKTERRNPGSKDYFQKSVRPVYLKIADGGTWPPRSSFFSFYTLTHGGDDGEIAYDGLGLRLKIDTPKDRFKGFALPIIDLFYGRFAE